MARKQEDNLKYFPLVVDFFEKDKRIRRLITKFGADGALYYIYILCKAYSNSYYVVYDDDFIEDAATDINCSTEKIALMTKYLLDKTLLDSTLFNTVKILTSHGIQHQYQESMKGKARDVDVNRSWWLLEEEETHEFIKVRPYDNKSEKKTDKSTGNTDKSTGNTTKEKRVKEKKREEIKLNEKRGEESFSPLSPSKEEVMEACRKSGYIYVDPERFYDFCKGKKLKGWEDMLGKWDREDRESFHAKNPPMTPQQMIIMMQDKGFTENDAAYAMVEARKRELKEERYGQQIP
jgi:hypothetical protein